MNITINMPSDPPYLFFALCKGRINYIANWSEIDFEIGQKVKNVEFNYIINVEKPNSFNSINIEFNETTIYWNFFGVNMDNSKFNGSFKIKDSLNRIQIMINKTESGYDLFYNYGARFPVKGTWTASLEIIDKENSVINFPISFLWIPKDILKSRGFEFI